jgi:hypothetical protein
MTGRGRPTNTTTGTTCTVVVQLKDIDRLVALNVALHVGSFFGRLLGRPSWGTLATLQVNGMVQSYLTPIWTWGPDVNHGSIGPVNH